MKIEAKFEGNIRTIYSILALPYPPKVPSQDAVVDQDDVEIEEIMLDVKPFKPKVQSYNINKDNLTNHRASKQLSKFIEDMERKRRENEDRSVRRESVNYLMYKENVVGFIDSLASIAKADKAETETINIAKIKQQHGLILDDLQHFTHILEADKNINIEQERRISENHDMNRRRETVHMLNQMGPIHNQLMAAFKKAGSSQELLKQISSEDFFSDSDSEVADSDREATVQRNAQLKTIFNNSEDIEKDPENRIIRLVEADIVPGSGNIGKTLKRCNKTFQNNLHELAENTKRKSEVQQDLLRSLVKKDIKKSGICRDDNAKGHGKMEMILDSVVHKVKAKEVEKEIAKDQKLEKEKLARQDTLEKIKDYGRRKSVLENPDTSYTTVPHDEKSEKAHTKLMQTIGRNDSKVTKQITTRKASILKKQPTKKSNVPADEYPVNKAIGRVATRRPTLPSTRPTLPPTPEFGEKPPLSRANTEKSIKFKSPVASGPGVRKASMQPSPRSPRSPGTSSSPRNPKPHWK